MNSTQGNMELLQAGYQLQQQGQLDLAEARYKQVLKSDPRNVHALNLMGMLMINGGRPLDAVELIKLALAENPRDGQAQGNLGLAYKDLGRFEEAVDHFRESISLVPNNPVMLNNLGNALREVGKAREAITHFENALRIDRSYAACWSNLAAAQRDVEDFGKAMKALDRALELDSNLAQAYHIRGTVFAKLAMYAEAVKAYDRSLALAPGVSEVMISKSDMLRDLSKPEEAAEVLKQVLDLEPRNPFAVHALGVLSEQLGDREQAAAYFKRSIECAPGYTSAHYQLAQLKGRTSSDQELEEMEDLWQTGILQPEDRKLLAFALFRVWDQRNETGKAWEYLAEGNRIKAESSPFDEQYTQRLTQGLIETASSLRERVPLEPAASSQPRVVFVLGMPRSGTTLTEQVLASHSEVCGAGEVSYAHDCARMASSMIKKPFPQCVADLSGAQLAEIGAYYLSRHGSLTESGTWIVDKTPLNFQYIGFMARALPNALFIHCHREPIDNCFSIHRIPFDEKQTYAHSLESLGKYYLQYRKLMAAWHKLYPDRILDVSYEETVEDLRAQCERMLEFLGLEFEPQLLEFYQARGLVKTPSASQVREPIYKDSVASWKKYEPYMQPLKTILDAGLPATK